MAHSALWVTLRVRVPISMLKRVSTLLLSLPLATVFACGQGIGPLRLTVSCSSTTVAQGLTTQCSAKKFFFRGSAQPKDVTVSVIWSSDSNAAQISNVPDSKGLLTANSQGSAKITATSGLLRASVSVTITPPVLLAIDVSPANANIALNETQQFAATGHNSNATSGPVTTNWSSSVPGVAGIDGASGLATPVAPGTTTITATNVVSGIFATAALNVELADITINPIN